MVRVVILAGGFGTRVRHLLPDIPKPMAPVAGRPFLEWVVRWFAHHGYRHFVLSTGHLSEVIERHFAATPVPGIEIRCVRETTPLGTAGGFLNCVEAEQLAAVDTWIVANGDSLVFADPRPLIVALESNKAEASLLGLALEDAGRYGSLDIDDAGFLRAFLEKRPGEGVINAGVYAFSSRAVRQMTPKRPASFEYDVFPSLAQGSRVAAIPVRAPFLDIGTPETLAQAEAFIKSNANSFTSPVS